MSKRSATTESWKLKKEEVMKVLITSGGTKVKIDRVRSISNMSRGTFGSQIAPRFLFNDWDVDFLAARDSRTPFDFKRVEDLKGTIELGKWENAYPFSSKARIRITPYTTFDEYEQELFRLLDENKYDAVVLAAAVSDYGVANYVDRKIHSSEEMSIELKPLPKLISRVKEHSNTYLVGFKLMVDSTTEELRDAMEKSFRKNCLNMIVGNDLRDIKQDNHTLTIGTLKKGKLVFEVYCKNECSLPETLVSKIIKGVEEQ